ncbi:queuine tRNA-ribosyltransferase [Legionella sp. km772]|uniref:queuine tRNA-ribosyltransferase n=1 Tax=Legionella sp. km772 TaxID=2498111 RepID=UPI000F8CBD70|nr:queuine tRNA-ribosyltransferase [Legionella sp. km772]RUR08503.1 queuine tRNA-ribosyltransferase [Legionella sp. km772]
MFTTSNWVPVLTSESGLCLTTANWQEAKINTAVYYLDALLLKPGLSLLKKLPNLGSYVNWPGKIIINASRLKANKVGEINLKSPYDGSKITIDYLQFIDLINHLKPDQLILPPAILKHYPQLGGLLNPNIFTYLCNKDLPVDASSNYGLYFQVENNFTSLIEELKKYINTHSCYVQGALDFEELQELAALSIPYIESEQPSEQGLNGCAYAQEGLIDLKELRHALSFTKLSDDCECSTCNDKLTKAYLHHLYHHTPLLAQRFIIQHNVDYVQNVLNAN